MSVQATSIAAYKDNADAFETMGDRIVAFMNGHKETRTRAEIAAALDVPTATMSGRVNDLLKRGRLIEEPGKFRCGITKNMVRGVSVGDLDSLSA